MSRTSSTALETTVPQKLRLVASYDKETFEAQTVNEIIMLSIKKINCELESVSIDTQYK
jgi:hypothetical protein